MYTDASLYFVKVNFRSENASNRHFIGVIFTGTHSTVPGKLAPSNKPMISKSKPPIQLKLIFNLFESCLGHVISLFSYVKQNFA